MRLEPFVTSAQAGKRPSSGEKGSGGFRTTALHVSIPGKAKSARRNTAVLAVRSKPVIAIAQELTAPVAVHVDGALVGLALKVGRSFVFFSAGQRTDHCDGQVFTSLAAIREAAGEIPASETLEAAGA
jgi:hypothetical protein